MCDPISISLAALQVAGAVAGYAGQNTAAHQQADAMQAEQRQRDAQLQLQQGQVNEQASQQMGQRAIEALQARGRLTAAFASSGLGGASQANILGSADAAAGRDMATLEANRASQIQQSQMQRQSGVMQANSSLAAIKQPSLIGAGLQIAGAVVGGYDRYDTRQLTNAAANPKPKG